MSSGNHVVRQGSVSVKEDSILGGWTWTDKWLVLREMTLTFLESDSENAQQSVTLLLRDITTVERTDLKSYCLVLETRDGKRFFLSVKSDHEVYGWQDDIYSLSPLNSSVSHPTNFIHTFRIGHNPRSGQYTGMPDDWKKLLEKSAITREEYVENSKTMSELLQIRLKLESQKRQMDYNIDKLSSGASASASSSTNGSAVVPQWKRKPLVPPRPDGPDSILASSLPNSVTQPTQLEPTRPLRVKTKPVPGAEALDLPPSISAALPDMMSPVDTIVYNHEQRAALLTQGLPPSDLRNALQSCYQRISAALLTVLDSRDAKDAVLLLEGERAQSFLDAVQDVLDKGSLPSAQHTSQARRLILRLSEARDRLPSSLFITGVTDYDEHPTFCGGFGDIYRASHNGSTVAVKRIRMFSGADSQRTRLQFCREALVWQTLQHKYVLPLIGIDRESFMSSFCLVSPWMKHGTVLKYLSEHGHEDVDKLLLQVAEGLEYLHSMNIVHGDLRGTNILVSDDWNACLADFGLTTITDAASTTTAALTSTAHHAGSARWFAPELIQPTSFGCEKFQRTPASDVYAFACVCLELHTGRPPFSGISPDVAAMLKVIAGERPAQPDASMSDGLWELVSAAWAQDFRDRPSIKAILQSMRTLNG